MPPRHGVTNKAEMPVQATEVCPGLDIHGASGPGSWGRPPWLRELATASLLLRWNNGRPLKWNRGAGNINGIRCLSHSAKRTFVMHICVGKTFPRAEGRSGEKAGRPKKINKKRDLGWYKIIISKYSCLWCEPSPVWEVFADFSECIRDSLKQTPPHTHTHTGTTPRRGNYHTVSQHAS